MKKKEKRSLVLLGLVYLAAQGFFNPFGLINPQLSKTLFVAFSIIAVLFAFRKRNVGNYPKWAYRCLMIGIIGASIMAMIFHAQSCVVSLVAILPYFLGYTYFFVLEKSKPSVIFLEKAFRILTICSLLIYIVNLVSFPTMIFGETKDEYDMSRGFVRIGMPMIEIVVTYFFYCINNWMIEKNKKNVFWLILTGSMIFMSLTRQIIALSSILGLLFIMQKASLFKKISVVVVCGFIVYVVLPQIPMVKTMIELSENQAINNQNDEDIRVTAWRFYTTEFQTNQLSPIFGNGVPSYGKSKWGNFVEQTTALRVDGGNACFTVDVGWAGFFWYFGGIATFGLLFLIIKGIKIHQYRDKQYLSYSLAFIGLAAIASGPILYYSQISSLSLILYMAYASKENRNNYPQLQ